MVVNEMENQRTALYSTFGSDLLLPYLAQKYRPLTREEWLVIYSIVLFNSITIVSLSSAKTSKRVKAGRNSPSIVRFDNVSDIHTFVVFCRTCQQERFGCLQ